MYKKPEIIFFEDEKLTKRLQTIDFPTDVEPHTTARKTVWAYNIGSQKLSNIVLSFEPSEDVEIKCAPPELRPMHKGLVVLEWTPKREYKLSGILNVDGGYPR